MTNSLREANIGYCASSYLQCISHDVNPNINNIQRDKVHKKDLSMNNVLN